MLSLYRPGTSALHRLPVGVKLVVLLLSGIGLFFVANPFVLGGFLLVVVGLWCLAGIPPVELLRQLRPLLLVLVLLGVAQVVLLGWASAFAVLLRLITLVLLATLVTMTSRTEDMISALERAASPLRVVGLRPHRIAFVLSLTLRFIPLIKEKADEIRAAQRARGVERSSLALLLPLLVKVLRMADHIAEALDARGLDDGR
ncbi:energy-coupling factor transporter transmembrane component T family protein [Allokutzneria albata]|uniref:Biotin transport system permease protein n=1 Tax=Allokutzneria albata TaxID=211114 RepID=A0A1G9R0K1_ALLAB|nr:energy-coupling factor transporter transmembrane component T [Allokutzneria albata]SDM16779.1 biotin transport system permease protein [Allokutzneria albata]